jgi:hypothetical protein
MPQSTMLPRAPVVRIEYGSNTFLRNIDKRLSYDTVSHLSHVSNSVQVALVFLRSVEVGTVAKVSEVYVSPCSRSQRVRRLAQFHNTPASSLSPLSRLLPFGGLGIQHYIWVSSRTDCVIQWNAWIALTYCLPYLLCDKRCPLYIGVQSVLHVHGRQVLMFSWQINTRTRIS